MAQRDEPLQLLLCLRRWPRALPSREQHDPDDQCDRADRVAREHTDDARHQHCEHDDRDRGDRKRRETRATWGTAGHVHAQRIASTLGGVSDDDAHYWLVQARNETEPRQLRRACLRAADLAPDDAKVLGELGMHLVEEHPGDAVALLDRALALAPDDLTARYNRACGACAARRSRRGARGPARVLRGAAR